MNAKTPKRKKKKGEPFPDSTPKSKSDPTGNWPQLDSYRWFLIGLFLLISVGGTYLVQYLRFGDDPNTPRFTYDVLKTHAHDSTSFTQGLVYDAGLVWESTGLRGESKLRVWKLESGDVVKEISLDPQYWGEGLAIANDKLYQLTYTENKCFVYDRDLNLLDTFEYEGQGWGLTFDGQSLIMSNGSSYLAFRDPETFETTREISVRDGRRPIGQLNELEYTGGRIYANRLGYDYVYEIDPDSGAVQGIIDLTNLWPAKDRPREGLLNGIAIDPISRKILVTGKYCPSIFEIKLKKL